MNGLREWLAVSGARSDARAGLQSADERNTSQLGPRPTFDPAGNERHAAFARARANQAEVEELREDIARAENEATEQVSTWLSSFGLAVALVVEFAGSILIMDVVGVSDRERLPLSLALAFAVLGITALAAQRTSSPSSDGGDTGSGALQVAKRSIVSIIIIAIYTLVVLSIAVVRVTSSLGEDAAPVEVLARTAIMVTTCIGPCWLAEWLIRKRAPALTVRKRLRVLRGRLKKALFARTRAEKAVDRIARDAERWDHESAKRRAAYQVAHRLETAKVQAEQGEP